MSVYSTLITVLLTVPLSVLSSQCSLLKQVSDTDVLRRAHDDKIALLCLEYLSTFLFIYLLVKGPVPTESYIVQLSVEAQYWQHSFTISYILGSTTPIIRPSTLNKK